jgi:hypothetical protein
MALTAGAPSSTIRSRPRDPAMPITAKEPRRSDFHSLSPHGFHRVVYFEWGDPRNRAS